MRLGESNNGHRQLCPVVQHLAILMIVLAGFVSRTHAQYAITRSTIAGGGGTSTGGVYTVTGTIGQPDAGAMSGGTYSLSGGFWSIMAIQTPGAPRLSLTRSNNTVIVSWPLSAKEFSLEQTSALSSVSNSWTTLPSPYASNATSFYYPIVAPAGRALFRLHKP